MSPIRERRWNGTSWGGEAIPVIPNAKPGPDNTGWDEALQDGTLTGSQFLSTPGQTIENKLINGKVVVQANNVTLRNCKITGGTAAEVVEFRNVAGGLIEHCTVAPP